MTNFDAAYSYGAYEGTLRELIHLFKYDGIAPLAKPLGDLMAAALPTHLRFDVIVPMPLHWLRHWRRGFNQSELLAKEVSRRLGIPVVKAVRRKRSTSTQTGLSPHQRRLNVAGAFAQRRWPEAKIKGSSILLVDDVLTTGATVSACAAALKKAGARQVTVLSLARADRRAADSPRDGASEAFTASVRRG